MVCYVGMVYFMRYHNAMDVVSYVDLNPVRAKMAGISETSGHSINWYLAFFVFLYSDIKKQAKEG